MCRDGGEGGAVCRDGGEGGGGPCVEMGGAVCRDGGEGGGGQCVEMVGRGGQCVEMGERGGGSTGSFVLYPDQGKSSGSPFRNTAANQCGGSGSVGIISLDPDPYKKSLDPESGSVSNYTDSPHCCQLFVRVGHCVLLRSAHNVLKRNVLFFRIFCEKFAKYATFFWVS